MGQTSSQALDDLQAQYDALENRRSAEGYAIRQRMTELRAGDEPQPAPPPPPPPSNPEEGILPDLGKRTLGGLAIKEKTAVYWCGVIPGHRESKDGEGWPPCHQIDGIGGGVTFIEFLTPHEGMGQDGSARRGEYAGALHELSESQVADIRRCLRSSLVRWRIREGRHRHGYVLRIPQEDEIEDLQKRFGLRDHEVSRLRVRADQFRKVESDEPVARYIYCVKVTGKEAKPGSKWRPSTELPPSVERAGQIESP